MKPSAPPRWRWWPLGLALAVTGSDAQMAEYCARRTATEVKAAPAAVARLRERRDERSLALADYLLAASESARAAAARASLQDRARSSTDPMVTVLALHMPCVQAGCRNIEASQWSRLEPDNLLAWLAWPARASADGRYVLDEIAAHVRYSRNYQQEAAALLGDLPPSGLELRQPWGLFNLRALAATCRAPADLATAEHCEAAAALLWSDEGAVERLIALTLAQRTLVLLPQRRAVWEPRLQELEAASRRPSLGPSGKSPRELACEAIVLTRAGERAAMGEADRARVAQQLAGASMGELRPRGRLVKNPPGSAPQ